MIIYSALNMVNGKRYVGQTTKDLKVRRSQHLTRSRKSRFKSALEKYKGMFLWVVLDVADSLQELDTKEQFWIQHYYTTDKDYGYNIKSGGLTSTGWKKEPMTQEHKDNISKGGMGRKFSAESRKKMSLASKGKPKSAEHRRKLGLNAKGRIVTEEVREKHRVAALKMTEQTKHNISAAVKAWWKQRKEK